MRKRDRQIVGERARERPRAPIPPPRCEETRLQGHVLDMVSGFRFWVTDFEFQVFDFRGSLHVRG